eukprot:1333219-Amphidinium_carterae.1
MFHIPLSWGQRQGCAPLLPQLQSYSRGTSRASSASSATGTWHPRAKDWDPRRVIPIGSAASSALESAICATN